MTAGWRSLAACAGADCRLFFGPDGETARQRQVREAAARRFCDSCPVRPDCLAFALAQPVRHGFWAGTTEEGRAAVRRRVMKLAADAARRAA
jgi:WhiB family transcriptional regulator, redox-sensing transcriptional regulator